ncbi:MAG TPA: glucosamine-6-phosphate deaminase [Nitrospiraceae bacterium]|nr:glucosamine-6-phosphate deaminase [Nitrospiraceae bacterium]
MAILITENAEEGSRTAARLVARAIRNRPTLRLGLAAGHTPTGLYRELVRLYRSEKLDCSDVRFFSLDEWMGLPSDSPNSFRSFFHHHLLDHLNVDPDHIHLLSGQPGPDAAASCAAYERLIRDLGGIDLQLLGIGRNGHLGFNEPGSSLHSRTRFSLLSQQTRRANARFFPKGQVPEWAMTVGIDTILEARFLMLLAFGKEKAAAVAKAVEGPLTASIPASAIQLHPAVIVVLDKPAAARLTNAAYYRREASHLETLLPDWLRQGPP